MRPPGPTHRALRAPRRPVALGPVRLHLQSAGGVQGRSLKPLTTPAGSGPSGSWPPPPASPGVRVPVGREASRRPCVPLRTWPTGSGGGILAAGGGVGRGPELQAAVGPAGVCTGQQYGRHRASPSGGPGAMWARQTGTDGAPPGGSRGRRAPRESACTGAQQRARWEWVPRSDSCPQVPVLNPSPQVPGSEASGGRHEAGPLSEDRDRTGRNAGAMSARPCRSLGARRLLLRGAGLTSGPGTVCNQATGLRCWHRGCHWDPTRAPGRVSSEAEGREGALDAGLPGVGAGGTVQAPRQTARPSGRDPWPGGAGELASQASDLAQPVRALPSLPPVSSPAHVTAVTEPGPVRQERCRRHSAGAAALTRPPAQSLSPPGSGGCRAGRGQHAVSPGVSFLLEDGHAARGGQGRRDGAPALLRGRTFLAVALCGPSAGRRDPPAAPGTARDVS